MKTRAIRYIQLCIYGLCMKYFRFRIADDWIMNVFMSFWYADPLTSYGMAYFLIKVSSKCSFYVCILEKWRNESEMRIKLLFHFDDKIKNEEKPFLSIYNVNSISVESLETCASLMNLEFSKTNIRQISDWKCFTLQSLDENRKKAKSFFLRLSCF